MGSGYYTVAEPFENTIIISKSRFITTVMPVRNADDAMEKLGVVRKKFSNATHNCYAYVASADGNMSRFSDDGEPSGTAGQPMLAVINGRNYRNILCVVTRYFGGVKLGTGGLVSAYSDSVSSVLDLAKTCYMLFSQKIEMKCDYSQAENIKQLIDKLIFNGKFIKYNNIEYTNDVKINISLDDDFVESFEKQIVELTASQVEINFLEKFYESYHSSSEKS